MKKKIIITTAIAACLTICAVALLQSIKIPEPDATSVTASQPTFPESERLVVPIIAEYETVRVPETEPAQEVATERLPEPSPEIENRKEPELESASPAQAEPKPAPEPTSTHEIFDPQLGNIVYIPGFGRLKSQGEGTVIDDEMMYENGNKVGSMG